MLVVGLNDVPEVEIINKKAEADGQVPIDAAITMQEEGGSQKSVLQSKLTKLAIQIGYAGKYTKLLSFVFHVTIVLSQALPSRHSQC